MASYDDLGVVGCAAPIGIRHELRLLVARPDLAERCGHDPRAYMGYRRVVYTAYTEYKHNNDREQEHGHARCPLRQLYCRSREL